MGYREQGTVNRTNQKPELTCDAAKDQQKLFQCRARAGAVTQGTNGTTSEKSGLAGYYKRNDIYNKLYITQKIKNSPIFKNEAT
jgi:hypothetical protein